MPGESEQDNFQPRESNENAERVQFQDNQTLNSAADLTNAQSNNSVREMEKSSLQSSQDILNSWNNFSLTDSSKDSNAKESKSSTNESNKKPSDSNNSNDVDNKKQESGTAKALGDKNASTENGQRDYSGQVYNAMNANHIKDSKEGNYKENENSSPKRNGNSQQDGKNDSRPSAGDKENKDYLSDTGMLASAGNSTQQGKSGGKPQSAASGGKKATV